MAAMYEQDFQIQLSHKIKRRLEKQYLREGALDKPELTALQSCDQAKQKANLSMAMSGSIAATLAFIVSRAPLTGAATSEQLSQMSYLQRQRVVTIGRSCKLLAYGTLAAGLVLRQQYISKERDRAEFAACVADPIQNSETDKSAMLSDMFCTRSEVESLYRSYLLKSNRLREDNESLKKYKFDPQAYH